MSDKWRYMVTVMPNVSIAPERFVRVVEVDGPDPAKALAQAMKELAGEETHLWQSDDCTFRVERVA